MKFVFIYGPPASGKLTVAKELTKITSYKLFDNHKIIDIFSELIDINKSGFWDSANTIKLKIIEECAKQKVNGVIFTMVYTKNPKNHIFPRKIKKAIEKYGGKVFFVKLECSQEEIMKRVSEESRKHFKKFHKKEELKDFTGRYNVHGALNFKDQLIINNTNEPARKVAQIIKKHFRL